MHVSTSKRLIEFIWGGTQRWLFYKTFQVIIMCSQGWKLFDLEKQKATLTEKSKWINVLCEWGLQLSQRVGKLRPLGQICPVLVPVLYDSELKNSLHIIKWMEKIQKKNIFLDMGKFYEIEVSGSINKISRTLLSYVRVINGLLLHCNGWVEYSCSRDYMDCRIQNTYHLALTEKICRPLN